MPMMTSRSASEQLWTALQDRQPARQLTPAPAVPRPRDRCSRLAGPAEDCLARRRAVREFTAAELSQSQVLAAIGAAHEAEAAVWPPGRHTAIGLDILVAAVRVAGLPAGLYTAREDGLELQREDDSCLAILRQQYADAPALLLICADLNHACREAGSAGYPDALIRAGTTGYGAWLWAVSAGLAGCVYGSASHDANAALRQGDENLRHLFTVALGVAAGGSESPP